MAERTRPAGVLLFSSRERCLDPKVCNWSSGRCVEPSRCSAYKTCRRGMRARAFDAYYRLRPAQAGKNRGLAYRLLKSRRRS